MDRPRINDYSKSLVGEKRKPFNGDRLEAEKNRKETKLAMLREQFTAMTQYEKDLEYIAEF